MSLNKIGLQARNIAIVGGGPSGVIAAKYLQAEKSFNKIVVFEQQGKSGGIWNYTGGLRDEDLFTVPQTLPYGKVQDPFWRDESSHPNSSTPTTNGAPPNQKTSTFLSPIYKNLETNIPTGLMRFQDLDWPAHTQLFPSHPTVRKYIHDYGKEVQHVVEYETQVVNIEPVDATPSGAWTVTTRHLRTHTTTTQVFDAVVVANGHFVVPYVPDIPGIREWNAKFPGCISHSKYYRAPEDFTGKNVVVVGNSASGSDISTQIAQYAQHPLLWSSKSDSIFKPAASTLKRELPPIARFLPESRGVVFEDGTVEDGIDAIVFATGYFYSLPFLEGVAPRLITDGAYVRHTYKHLFYAPRPTLAFLALNQRVIPFATAEAQAAVVARVYSGRLELPPLDTMKAWEHEHLQTVSSARNFHLMPFPKDGAYINELASWALSATRCEGLENEGNGKKPPVWGEWEFWCRENFPKIRAAFVAFGQKRFGVKTLEEVGFDFQEHLREKAREEGKMI